MGFIIIARQKSSSLETEDIANTIVSGSAAISHLVSIALNSVHLDITMAKEFIRLIQ